MSDQVGNPEDRFSQNEAHFLGIGYSTAVHLDKLGFTVFAGCLLPSGDGATSLKEACSDRLHVLSLDVTNDHDISDAVEFVKNNCPTRGILYLSTGRISLRKKSLFQCMKSKKYAKTRN